MVEHGFRCYAIDPDRDAAQHARQSAQVHYAHAGYLDDFPINDVKFDLITFNKVLEHVENPVELLKLAASRLADDGVIYIELPDGQSALEQARLQRT